MRLSSGFGSGRLTPLAVGAAKASIGHSEAPSGQAGLQRLSSALARRAAGGNAQLRRLSPHVGELWSSAAEAPNTQPVQPGVGVGVGVGAGGVSSFGYSGTIAYARAGAGGG